ncbi:ABC-three component system protein [Clostridium perfringens]|uniref:ABC-three component system protein n=1 Tax=Clostridium perfringens TaxID=1502 RepID=UPI00112329AE|nr:ABC-three component system protein [Clostridium perfringens]TPE20171.1 hypothetical protein FJM09_01790 [Clostridium perfringens]
MFYHKFEAIASWYGYDYQGVLAIYYTLKQINKLISDITETKEKIRAEDVYEIIRGYSIELEYMEDFAIKYNNKYQSFNQVKSGESKIKDEDVRDLYLKLLEYDNNGENNIFGYFHVNEKDKIEMSKDKVQKSIKAYFESLKSEIIELKDKENIDFRSKKKGGAIQILASYMDEANLNKHKKDKRGECIDRLIYKLDEINNNYFDKDEKYKEVFRRLFEYDEAFNSINKIENEIYNQLKEIHKKLIDQEHKINDSYLEKEKCKLGVIVNKHIDKRKDDDSNKDILFEEFFKILNEDLNEWGYSAEYLEYKFKEKLHTHYFQYKSDREDSEKCSECNEECYLKNELEKIKELKPEEFKKFLNNISIVKRESCFDFPSESEIKQTIFRCMCENHKIGRMEKYSIGIEKENNAYWVIANLDDEEIPFIKKLFREENDNKDILRDADILITRDISIADIRKYNKYFSIDKDDLQEVVEDNLSGRFNEIDNYTKNRVSAIKRWKEVKGELE